MSSERENSKTENSSLQKQIIKVFKSSETDYSSLHKQIIRVLKTDN